MWRWLRVRACFVLDIFQKVGRHFRGGIEREERGGRLFFFTERVAMNDVIVVNQPGINGDEVGDKTGNAALEHGAIPADDMFQVDIRLVRLMHHYIIAIDH